MNCCWRTPGPDGGRDIEGIYTFIDPSGFSQTQKWYVECKKYSNSIDWTIIWKKIAHAEAHKADILLFMVSNFITPQAIDNIAKWNKGNRRPLIRFLNSADLHNRIQNFPEIGIKYALIENNESNARLITAPMTDLLLNTIYSITASMETGIDIEPKMALAQAVTDLISTRSNDIAIYEGIHVYPFHEPEDSYEWVESSIELEKAKLDRYGVRAILSYISIFRKSATKLKVSKASEKGVLVHFSIENEKAKARIQDICFLSDISVNFSNNGLFFLERNR